MNIFLFLIPLFYRGAEVKLCTGLTAKVSTPCHSKLEKIIVDVRAFF